MMQNFKETKKAEHKILNIIFSHKKVSKDRFYRWKKISMVRKY